jgi:hypothetical protein
MNCPSGAGILNTLIDQTEQYPGTAGPSTTCKFTQPAAPVCVAATATP